MKRYFLMIISVVLILLHNFCFAEEINWEGKKANIYLKPEDSHPNGINMEIGTASFWFEVGANVSGESGETVSYQWYESKTGKIEDIVAIPNETKEIFVPEQEIGTKYYCVGVITRLGNESTIEYTKLLEATFTPKVIDKIWITNVVEPSVGEEPSMSASPYTDYELNNYYGYEINSVKWIPNDSTFKEGVEYRVDINLEFWDNVKCADKLDVKINSADAEFIKNESSSEAVISYTFDKLEIQENEKDTPNKETEESGETNLEIENIVIESNNEDEKLDMSAIVLSTMFVIVLIFALLSMKRKNK